MATTEGPAGSCKSGGLSAEQLRRIEENRHRARERLAGRSHTQQQPSNPAHQSLHQSSAQSHNNSSHHFGVNKPSLTVPDGSKPSSSCSGSRSISMTSSSSMVGGISMTSSSSSRVPAGGISMTSSSKGPVVGGGQRRCVELVRPSMRATLRLLPQKRFEVVVPYDKQTIEVFKKTPTNTYNAKGAIWTFGIEVYDKLVAALQRDCRHIELSQIPRPVVSLFQSPRLEQGTTTHWDGMGTKLNSTLMQFQREGIDFCIRCGGKALLADDMGLGKTLQALAVMSHYRSNWPLLIICPSSVRMTWAEACQRWLSPLREDDVSVVVTGKLPSTNPAVTIISYDLATRLGSQLTQRKPDAIIADESHFLKNYKTNRCKAILPLIKSASRCLLLSGTPALSRPIELYTQITALDKSFKMTLVNFGIRYCSAVKNQFGWDFSGASNLNELQLYMQEKFMIRRLKKDVLDQLPSKRRQTVLLDPSLTKTQSKEARELRKELEKAGMCKAMNRRNALLPLFEKTGRLKLPAVRGYILDLMEGGRKLIVFAHHKSVLDSISECLLNKGYEHIRIDGRTPTESRQLLCDRFQHDDSCLVALLSITTANAGLTLTASSTVVFAELFWNPGILIQAEDRVYRIGQKNSVVIHYLVARETVDDFIWPMIQSKLTVLNKAGLAVDDFSNTDSTILKSTGLQQSLLNFVDTELDTEEGSTGDGRVQGSEATSSGESRKNKRKRPLTMLEDCGFTVQREERAKTPDSSGNYSPQPHRDAVNDELRNASERKAEEKQMGLSNKSKSTDLASYLLSQQSKGKGRSSTMSPTLQPDLGVQQSTVADHDMDCSTIQHTSLDIERASSASSSTVEYPLTTSDGGCDDWLLQDCDLATFDDFDDT